MSRLATRSVPRGPAVTLCLAISLCLGVGFALPAQAARSHFKVVNNWKNGVQVRIYDGSDGVCVQPRATRRVGAGETKTLHCKGQGNDRCKVEIRNPNTAVRLCKGLYNTCDNQAKTTADGATIIVNGTGQDDCSIDK